MTINLMRFLLLFIAFSLNPTFLKAKDFPQKPINLVVPFAPGGGTDSIARDLAKNLTEQLGQAVIVDNRAGGGGAIGAQMVAKAEPDGYTLLFVTSTFITHAATENTLSYDVIKDFTPIAMIGRGPLMVVANSELGLKSIQDLVKYTKTNPNGVNFCSAGQGSINHLAGELFKQKTNLEMTHVPYKGSGPATLDLLAGRVQVFFATMPTMLQYVKSNKVTLLAMTSDKRSSLFPLVPTVSESGVPGFNITTWWGVVAPAKLPPEILKKLNQEIRIASTKEPLKTRLVSEGATPFQTEPDEMQVILEKELKMWRDLVNTANIKVN
ncbi:tripartite tricarboxylate transporter substrate binding protein [Polynucleobacter rarus]|jgi:tripartite-type tricarboxylate transporter receptor subunit TctC|uniref:tripartite tricarboxylate transporter substrate binding protein n=1 Tax=Polynucleobacter rarus TaxID=556055 RepID=UPI000D3E2B4D|nr:tripartite tricarboxylate transporter substrate binding protein [Polynucleobacter rarus]